jgi:hypothetical protein
MTCGHIIILSPSILQIFKVSVSQTWEWRYELWCGLSTFCSNLHIFNFMKYKISILSVYDTSLIFNAVKISLLKVALPTLWINLSLHFVVYISSYLPHHLPQSMPYIKSKFLICEFVLVTSHNIWTCCL